MIKRKRIEKYARKGKILDIGCGRGLFLDIMRRGGWEVEGSELNNETASYAKQVYDLKVHAGGIAEQSLASESFEVINICGVLAMEAVQMTHRIMAKMIIILLEA